LPWLAIWFKADLAPILSLGESVLRRTYLVADLEAARLGVFKYFEAVYALVIAA